MKGAVAEQNYWPGYLDALINVMLNLLFLVAVFAIGLLLLNVQTMSQQRQLTDLGAQQGELGAQQGERGAQQGELGAQTREILNEMGLGEAQKGSLLARLERLNVAEMVERRRRLGLLSEEVAAQESLMARIKLPEPAPPPVPAVTAAAVPAPAPVAPDKADAAEAAVKRHGDSRLAVALLREVGAVEPAEYKRQTAADAVGVRCVGAPVVDAAGKVRGAISVAGPAYRMTMARVQGLGPELAEAGRRIGAQLAVHAAMNTPAQVQVVPGPWAFRGEFARWCLASRSLYWADSLAPAVRVFDGRQDRELAVFDAPLTGLLVHADRLLVASDAGYWLLDELAAARARVGPLQPWPGAAPCALCTAPDGSVWTCQPSGAARWRVAPLSPDATPADSGWVLTEALNALAWDSTGCILYGLASASGVILVMQRGQPAVRRLATVPTGSGLLSGLAVDASGGIWTALQGGWSVLRFAPDGSQDRVIGLPVPSPSDVMPGGQGTLYVTSARQPVSLEALGNAPLSGRLFEVQLAA